MSLLVIAYPVLSENDNSWIQSIREKYDKKYYHVIKPHFTIIFPLFNFSEKILFNHVKNKIKYFRRFYFVLRCASVVKDSFSGSTDVFLIPEEGYRFFVKLHDILYTGPLAKELRLDIPFMPHIGVANDVDPHKCKHVADSLNLQNFEIAGSINGLDIIKFENNSVETIDKIAFEE